MDNRAAAIKRNLARLEQSRPRLMTIIEDFAEDQRTLAVRIYEDAISRLNRVLQAIEAHEM
jgi:predicted transcriptional regulator